MYVPRCMVVSRNATPMMVVNIPSLRDQENMEQYVLDRGYTFTYVPYYPNAQGLGT